MTRHASHKVDDHVIERAILNLNKQLREQTQGSASLSVEQKAEQKHAIRHMTGSKQLALVVGVAGAGKTTIMTGAKEALEVQGYRVRISCPLRSGSRRAQRIRNQRLNPAFFGSANIARATNNG